MYWYIWWAIAAAITAFTWIDAFILSKLRYKSKRILSPGNLLFGGTFLSAFALLCPVYHEIVAGAQSAAGWVQTVFVTVQHSFRLFLVEDDYLDLLTQISAMPVLAQQLYRWLGVILYTLAPVLTFGFILSFFKNLTAQRRYFFSFWKHTHVFSELNEKTLALATSIMEKDTLQRRFKLVSGTLIVFTGVSEQGDDAQLELIDKAKELGALLLQKDLESIKYRRKRSLRRLHFYLISYDETAKMRHAESIMNDYDYENTELFVFSDDVRLQLLLAAKSAQHMKVIRVNDIQSLIYHDLDEHGLRLFEKARDVGNGERLISVVIVGLGKYGKEMLKALSWFCQLQGYKLKINAFDIDKDAESRFADACPDLMSEAYNGQDIPGEARYEIHIHAGVDIASADFAAHLARIKDATLVFVALGDDKTNLTTAVKLRTLCEGMRYTSDGHKPDIETVIYDSSIAESMGITWCAAPDKTEGVTNFKGQAYNIRMIGDLAHFYSVDTVINSELVEAGRQVHLRYDSDDSGFWQYEYNYRSSIAKALHERLRRRVSDPVPGADKPWDRRTPEEKLAIGKVEHVRWNAYMRSEGYRYSGSQDKRSRNDLAKLHHNLVPVTALSDDDLRKDA